MRGILNNTYLMWRAAEWVLGALVVLVIVAIIKSGVLWSLTDNFVSWYSNLLTTELEVQQVGPPPPERPEPYEPGVGLDVWTPPVETVLLDAGEELEAPAA